MRALVTGDKGFLGRHFAAALRTAGFEVTGLDVRTTDSLDCRAFFQSTASLKRGEHFDLVVHAAAVIKGRETIDGAPLATAVNLSLDAEMFRWASVVRPGRVVYISSSAAYPVQYQTGVPRQLVENDQNPYRAWVGQPDQVYGWSKVVGEMLAGRLRELDVPVTVVRPFSGYGHDQDDTYPFPAFVARAVRRDDPFEVWCGECVRDFVHVDDIVGATMAAVAARLDGPLNIATGRATSFTQLAGLVCAAAGYEPGLLYRGDKPTGVRYRVGDPTRMNEIYVPKWTLEQGIAEAIERGGETS